MVTGERGIRDETQFIVNESKKLLLLGSRMYINYSQAFITLLAKPKYAIPFSS